MLTRTVCEPQIGKIGSYRYLKTVPGTSVLQGGYARIYLKFTIFGKLHAPRARGRARARARAARDGRRDE